MRGHAIRSVVGDKHHVRTKVDWCYIFFVRRMSVNYGRVAEILNSRAVAAGEDSDRALYVST